MFGIEFELGQAADGLEEQPIRTFINENRHYIMRWSPLNLDFLSEFIEIEAVDAEELETNAPAAIFDLPATSYALVTLDLRHLPEEAYEAGIGQWTYGDDWAISFTIDPELDLTKLSRPK